MKHTSGILHLKKKSTSKKAKRKNYTAECFKVLINCDIVALPLNALGHHIGSSFVISLYHITSLCCEFPPWYTFFSVHLHVCLV